MQYKQSLEIVLDFVERWNKQDAETKVAEAAGILEEELQTLRCKEGDHNMVKDGMWGSTCTHCGKYEK